MDNKLSKYSLNIKQFDIKVFNKMGKLKLIFSLIKKFEEA